MARPARAGGPGVQPAHRVDSGPSLAGRLPGCAVVSAQPSLVVYRLTGPVR